MKNKKGEIFFSLTYCKITIEKNVRFHHSILRLLVTIVQIFQKGKVLTLPDTPLIETLSHNLRAKQYQKLFFLIVKAKNNFYLQLH